MSASGTGNGSPSAASGSGSARVPAAGRVAIRDASGMRSRAAGATPSPSSSGPAKQARTLKQPMTLHVAEAAPGRVSSSSSGSGDAAEYARALKRRAAAARRAEKWIDRAMEEVLNKDDFLKALGFMHAAAYAEVVHERHLNGMCGYALCSRAPAAPYRSRKRWLVSTAARTITEREGNDDEAFCGPRCAKRSAYLAAQLDTQAPWLRGTAQTVTLLDDLEAAGEVEWTGKRGDVLHWVKKGGVEAIEDVKSTTMATEKEAVVASAASAEAVEGVNGASGASSATETSTKEPSATEVTTTEPSTAARSSKPTTAATSPSRNPETSPSPTPAPGSGMNTLLASLSIVERETPSGKPRAPVLGEPRLPVEPGRPVGISSGGGDERTSSRAVGHVSPQPQPQPQSYDQATDTASAQSQAATLPPPPKSARAARRDASLIGTQHKSLANSVLDASRRIPVPRDAADSDAESSASEEDWAKAMGWGKGPEVDALFAEASAARALLDEGEGGSA